MQFGTGFNSANLKLSGSIMHKGDVFVQSGDLHMYSGLLKVRKLKFSRVHKAYFRGAEAHLGAARPEFSTVDLRGHLQFIDIDGSSSVSISPVGYVQAQEVSVGRMVHLRSDVS